MVQSAQDRDLGDRAAAVLPAFVAWLVRNLLTDPLVRSRAVEVLTVLTKNDPKVLLAENDRVIEAFAPNAAEEPLAHRVGVRRPH